MKNYEKDNFFDGAIKLCVFEIKWKYFKFECYHKENVISINEFDGSIEDCIWHFGYSNISTKRRKYIDTCLRCRKSWEMFLMREIHNDKLLGRRFVQFSVIFKSFSICCKLHIVFLTSWWWMARIIEVNSIHCVNSKYL